MGLHFGFPGGTQLERVINDGQQFVKVNQLLLPNLDNMKLAAANHVPDKIILYSRFGICLAELSSCLSSCPHTANMFHLAPPFC